MSTIYIPQIIESQEEADALPDGTVAIRDGYWPRILLRDETGQHWASWEAVGMTRPDMRGWTALVPTDAALTIDQHRVEKRWVGDGVRIECHCGHESNAVWDPAAEPLTEENNTHRVADRLHSVHVADMLSRAARRDEKDRP